jgi:Leucine-rich repeat (LRR) protein
MPGLRVLRMHSLALEATASLAKGEFPALERLDVSGNKLGAANVRALAKSKKLGRLKALDVSDTVTNGHVALTALVAGELPALERLGIGGNSIGAANLAKILASMKLPSLRHLSIYKGFATGVLAAVCASAAAPRLRTLDLAWNFVGGEEVDGLVKKPLPDLRELVLLRSRLGEGACASLGKAARRMPHLQVLNLHISGLGKKLSGLEKLERLVDLDVSFNGRLDDTAKIVVALPRLRRLNLEFVDLVDTEVKEIVSAASLSQLQDLNLAGNPITDEGAIAIAETKLPIDTLKIGSLQAEEEKMTRKGYDALLARFGAGLTPNSGLFERLGLTT